MIENLLLEKCWLLLVHSPFHLAQAIMGELVKMRAGLNIYYEK